MLTTPKITIITPTFNSVEYVQAALESVSNQSYKNVEHLIIDGYSTDGTVEIVKKFQKEYPHIRLISEKDNGIYDAMNKGIKASSGDWLYFLGSDDRIINNGVLENIHSIILSVDCDVIYGNVFSKRFNGRYDGEFTYKKILSQNICHQSVFFKKTIFKKTGLFNLKYKSHADWNHNFQWFLSPYIKKKYYDIIIAEYADEGYSSSNYDKIFEKDKIINFMQYGNKTIPFNFKLLLLMKEVKKCIVVFDFLQILKIGLITPKIIAGI
jgi:glycosyltransferase involved in cell wall biosynthesis